MNKTTKTILIVIGSLLLVCVCAAGVLLATGAWSIGQLVQWADQNVTENPQEVAQIASGIADFEVPAGYNAQMGMSLAGFSMVQYATGDDQSILIVAQFPAGTSLNPDEMLRQIREGRRDPNSSWYKMDTKLVEQKQVTIRGEATTLSLSEGTNDQGILYRMANAVFQGKGTGPSLFILAAPADEWSDQVLDDFIASIQ
jgi:ABC-type molybdate transport system substrate-binding protein